MGLTKVFNSVVSELMLRLGGSDVTSSNFTAAVRILREKLLPNTYDSREIIVELEVVQQHNQRNGKESD